jgi:hypothetical protein
MRSSFWRGALPLLLVAMLVLAAALAWGLRHMESWPVLVTVNGVGLPQLLDLHAPTAAHELNLVVALAAMLLLALLLVPLLVLFVVLCVVLPLCFAFGIGLLVPGLLVALLIALLLGPPLLLCWALWRLLRRPTQAPAAATIPS